MSDSFFQKNNFQDTPDTETAVDLNQTVLCLTLKRQFDAQLIEQIKREQTDPRHMMKKKAGFRTVGGGS